MINQALKPVVRTGRWRHGIHEVSLSKREGVQLGPCASGRLPTLIFLYPELVGHGGARGGAAWRRR